MSESSNAAAIPRHLRNPGEDGYRTPTIEDAERAVSVPDDVSLSLVYPSSGIRQVRTSALEFLRDVNMRSAGSSMKAAELPRAGLSHDRDSCDIDDVQITWKQRIRHVTWAFFTLTMATGGIANALYDGNC